MFSWLFGGLWHRSVNVKILTLISEVQHERGKYTLNFDVFKEESSEPLRATRRQEQYVELPCISGACSGQIEVPLVGRKGHIQIKVTGALTPATEPQSGEDTLEYKESLSENRKILHLTPTYDGTSDGMAFIKFWVDGNVKHTVIVHDVPITRADASSSSLYAYGSEEVFSLPTNKEFGYSEQKDSSIVRAETVRSSGFPDVQCMALPKNPRPVSGPNPVPPEPSTNDDNEGAVGMDAGSAAAENDQADDGATGTSRVYDKILSNASLHCLANVLPPKDANSLLIQLNVAHSVLEHKKRDHLGDSVGTVYQCLLHWRQEGAGGENQAPNKQLYESLINQLERAGLRDIKRGIQRAFNAKKELEKCDFKNH